MERLLRMFREVWIWDTEFIPRPGWHVTPVCLTALEYRSGKSITLALGAEGKAATNPLPFGPDALHIVFSATAELGFALAMGWSLPVNVLDLWVERRNLTNGMVDNQGYDIGTNLIATCQAYGVPTLSLEDKEANQQRILRGYPFTNEELRQAVDYCAGDTRMLRDLAIQMLPSIQDIGQALHRGRCMNAIACMEWNGVPVDVETFTRLCRHSEAVRRSVVRDFEEEHQAGIHWFDDRGNPHFVNKGYTAWVKSMGFRGQPFDAWPFTDAGLASADDNEVLKPMATQYAHRFPVIGEYRDLRKFLTLAKSKIKFPVGPDGRNRTQMRPFSAKSSRSQPPTSENIPNATKALRSLLAPRAGEVLLHRDWSNAEYGIAAALAGDTKRWEHYLHRDAYLVKAADFGYCDYTATKETHRELRNKFKPAVIAGQYGQTAKGLAFLLGISLAEAEACQRREKKLYPVYQRWLDDNDEARAFMHEVCTVLGWRLHIPLNPSNHILRRALNHPIQGNCAEIMRYTACLATERGIDLGGSVHDSFHYTAPADCWEEVDAAMKSCMDEACKEILGEEYVLRSDRDVVHHPDHYSHEDGRKMWSKIAAAIQKAELDGAK